MEGWVGGGGHGAIVVIEAMPARACGSDVKVLWFGDRASKVKSSEIGTAAVSLAWAMVIFGGAGSRDKARTGSDMRKEATLPLLVRRTDQEDRSG